MTSESEVEDGLSEARISRRNALRAALGGSAAAVAWTAPRIEGFSIVPDFAAAASCVSGSPSTSTTASRATTNDCGGQTPNNEACCIQCWNSNGIQAPNCFDNGYYGNTGCNAGNRGCGNATNNRLAGTTLNIAKTSPPSTNITLNYNIWGPVDKTDFGENAAMIFTLTGIDPPYQNCRVTMNGACDNGAFTFGACNAPNTSVTFPANGNYSNDPGSVSTFFCTANNGNVALTPGCRSTSNLGNNNCTSNGSITITLSCTCA